MSAASHRQIFLTRVRKLAACARQPRYLAALLGQGVGAAIEHETVLRGLADCRTVVDIGANRGQFALATRAHLPLADIVSFEPLPGPAAIFRKVFAGDSRTTLHESAIGAERGRTTLHVSARDDSSSLLPITSTQSDLFPGTEEAGITSVDVGLLGDFLNAGTIMGPALLKLDVQGFELQALRGCDSLLEAFDYIYVECSFVELYQGQALADEVIAFLRERAFVLRGAYNAHHDARGRSVQADLLFARQPAR
jgi:FkbM family methyltransferase